MTVEEMKTWIDHASYEQLLRKWRFAPIGDLFFQPPVGEYFTNKLVEKREEVGDGEHVRASKTIGWD